MEQTKNIGIVDEPKGLLVSALDPSVEIVRFKAYPYPWMIRAILARAPKVRMIVLENKHFSRIRRSESCMQILAERSVILRAESHAYNKGELVKTQHRTHRGTKLYRAQRDFLVTLDSERQALLDELFGLGWMEVEVVRRYFCLNDEQYVPSHELAKQHGISAGALHVYAGTVLYYLDSAFEVSKQSIAKIPMLEKRVEQERERLQNVESQKEELLKHGLEKVPIGMPLRFIKEYALVYRAWCIDELSEMTVAESERAVLVARYGLEDNTFKTLEAIGETRGLTRERIRQLEAKALRKLRRLEKKQE